MSDPLIPNSKSKEKDCPRCWGKKTLLELLKNTPTGTATYRSRSCPWCNGTGKEINHKT